MPTIDQLSRAQNVSASDKLPIYISNTGDTEKVSLSVLLSYLQNQSTGSDNLVTQRESKNSSDWTIQADSSTLGVWLIITVSGSATDSGTITLPLAFNCVDNQTILVNSTAEIESLIINANGATAVYGAPDQLGTADFEPYNFGLRYNQSTNSWYRVS